MEFIIRIIHLITTKYGFQTTLIKSFVMRHERESLYQRLYLSPNIWKDGSIVCILTTETVNLRTPIVIVVWLWLNE